MSACRTSAITYPSMTLSLTPDHGKRSGDTCIADLLEVDGEMSTLFAVKADAVLRKRQPRKTTAWHESTAPRFDRQMEPKSASLDPDASNSLKSSARPDRLFVR